MTTKRDEMGILAKEVVEKLELHTAPYNLAGVSYYIILDALLKASEIKIEWPSDSYEEYKLTIKLCATEAFEQHFYEWLKVAYGDDYPKKISSMEMHQVRAAMRSGVRFMGKHFKSFIEEQKKV